MPYKVIDWLTKINYKKKNQYFEAYYNKNSCSVTLFEDPDCHGEGRRRKGQNNVDGEEGGGGGGVMDRRKIEEIKTRGETRIKHVNCTLYNVCPLPHSLNKQTTKQNIQKVNNKAFLLKKIFNYIQVY